MLSLPACLSLGSGLMTEPPLRALFEPTTSLVVHILDTAQKCIISEFKKEDMFFPSYPPVV